VPAKLSEKERIRLIERVIVKGEPVSRVCQKAGISRVLFYRWLKRYKEEGTVAPKRPLRVPSRRVPEAYVVRIIELVRLHPSWSTRKISEALGKDKEGKPLIGNHGVQNVLLRLKLNTAQKRKEFAQKVKGLSDKQALALARGVIVKKPLIRVPELSAKQRLEAIKRVLVYNEPVAQVCIDFHISRPTFYKWLKRYQEAPEDKRLEALQDKKPKVERYYRQTPEKYEEAVLSVVAQYPEFGVARIIQVLPQIAGKPIVGHHGVQNILRRYGLSTYQQRLAYAQAQVTPVTRFISVLTNLGTRFITLPALTRVRVIKLTGILLLSCFSTIVVLGTLGYFVTLLTGVPVASRIGFFFATTALLVGSIFFAYSAKYYFTLALVLSFSRQSLEEGGGYVVGLNGKANSNQSYGEAGGWLSRIFGLGNGSFSPEAGGSKSNGLIQAGGLQPSLERVKLKKYPFFSIHLPFYNEKKVAERILSACTSFDWPNYEVIVCDDSNDETVEIVERFAREHNKAHPNGPKVKVLHRPTRAGFKGGALSYALKAMDKRTEFVVVFDADFVPYPDTLELFAKYFKVNNNGSEDYKTSQVAAVTGYQWHVLNKSENWVTRGVRTEYAGSYVIERSGREILGALKQIHGSVYAIRADVLKKVGWGTSITEDFQLTLKLYEKGYKVVYTPYIQAPAECVSTIKRLIRQRMRWAEGHSNCTKKMFLKLLTSPKLTLMEKLEFLYLSPYYLQAFFFLVGTFSWLISETVFATRLPFWTSLWGWSLVLTNFFALPLVNGVGLFLEEAEERDYVGLLSFIALSYLLVPFQAYASVKGFLEREEGPWFRTPKTGKVTDIFTRGRFYRFITRILPVRRPAPAIASASIGLPISANPYLVLATANNRFNGFRVKPKRLRFLSKAALAILLAISVTIFTLSYNVSMVKASTVNNFYLADSSTDEDSADVSTLYNSGKWQKQESAVGGSNIDYQPGYGTTQWWYSREYPTGDGDATLVAGTYYFNFYVSGNGNGSATGFEYTVEVGYCDGGCDEAADYHVIATSATITYPKKVALGLHQETIGSQSSDITFTSSNKARIYLKMWVGTTNSVQMGYNGSSANYISSLQTPNLTIPENVLLILTVAPFIPMVVMWMKKRGKEIKLLGN